MLSSVGLPGLNGFVGEYLILLGSFQANPWLAALAVTGVVWGAIYLLSVTRRVLFGPVTRKANLGLADLNGREIGLMLPVVALCVWIGVSPNTFLDRTDGSIDAIVERVEEARRLAQADGAQPPKVGQLELPAEGRRESSAQEPKEAAK